MDFNFLKYYKVFFILSMVICVAFVIMMFTKGYKYGTDFTGGIEITLSFENEVSTDNIKEKLTAAGLKPEIEKILTIDNAYRIRHLLIDNDPTVTEDKFVEALNENFDNVKIDQIHVVGGIMSSQNQSNAYIISLIVVLLIVGYLTMRFNFSYSIAAIVAVIHDVIIMLGMVIILGYEMDVLIIVAVLTIFGYSVNDSIILFDRIREKHKDDEKHFTSYIGLLNHSLTSVFSRTLITSFTTFIVVFALFISTTGHYQNFASVIMIGVVSGTYSSIYIACVVLVLWEKKRSALVPKK